ncbi:uncharacterized protein LOC113561597 [Ooceraea biroi]|uniref:uncharacterized protein LOC113561597 n=1 Tax=Ooceraea biroi TaxID=2015173 RepID=UPI000F08AADB|nr:uncharacterized protein LOC113561597 [Ooceraea biroi]
MCPDASPTCSRQAAWGGGGVAPRVGPRWGDAWGGMGPGRGVQARAPSAAPGVPPGAAASPPRPGVGPATHGTGRWARQRGELGGDRVPLSKHLGAGLRGTRTALTRAAVGAFAGRARGSPAGVSVGGCRGVCRRGVCPDAPPGALWGGPPGGGGGVAPRMGPPRGATPGAAWGRPRSTARSPLCCSWVFPGAAASPTEAPAWAGDPEEGSLGSRGEGNSGG